MKMSSNLMDHKIKASVVMKMINARLERVDMKYQYGQKEISKEAYAEVKMEIAELKMIFVDYILESKEQELTDPDQ
jgi:hypothetical protein